MKAVLLPFLLVASVILLLTTGGARAADDETVYILDFVSQSTSLRAQNFVLGFTSVLNNSGNVLHSNVTIELLPPSNADDYVESLTTDASNDAVPIVLGPVTDETLWTLLSDDVVSNNYYAFFSPLTSTDYGLDFVPHALFTQNTPMIQMTAMVTYAMNTLKAKKVGVMYVTTPSDVSSDLSLGAAEVTFLKNYWGSNVHVITVSSTDDSISSSAINSMVNKNPQVIFILDRLGSSTVSLSFFNSLITHATVISKGIVLYAPYASTQPFSDAYTSAAAVRATIVDPSKIIFSSSNPVLLDSERYTFLSDFATDMAASGIDVSTTGTSANTGLIEGWVAGKVLMDMYNQYYYPGITRETFYKTIYNQNRYLVGSDFSIGPYAGSCTSVMVSQEFMCSSSQGARMVFLNQLTPSSQTVGSYTVTPIIVPSGSTVFPVSKGPVNSNTVTDYTTSHTNGNTYGSTSDGSGGGFPWWLILLFVIFGLLLLLLLLWLLLMCCGCGCCAGCCACVPSEPMDSKGELTFVSVNVLHKDALWEAAPDSMAKAMKQLRKVTKDLVSQYHCYESTHSARGDESLVVCPSADAAARLSHHMETRLMEHQWGTEELHAVYARLDHNERRGVKWDAKNMNMDTPSSESSSSDVGRRISDYKGPRVGLGAHTGLVDSVEYDETTKRYRYEGHTVTMAEQAAAQTNGSRILITQATKDGLTDGVRKDLDFIQTPLTVRTEENRQMPLHELRTPVTNQSRGSTPVTTQPAPVKAKPVSAVESVPHQKEPVVAVVPPVQPKAMSAEESTPHQKQPIAAAVASPKELHAWEGAPFEPRPPRLSSEESQEPKGLTPAPVAQRVEPTEPEAQRQPPPLVARSEEPSKSPSNPQNTGATAAAPLPMVVKKMPRYQDAAVQTNSLPVSAREKPPVPVETPRDHSSVQPPPNLFLHSQPTEKGDMIIPCFSEGNGLLFRIVDGKTDTWSYYNDTTEYVMVATLLLGKRSVYEPLDGFRTVWNPKVRKYEGEVVVQPLQTKRVLRGDVNGYSIAYAARLKNPE